MDALDLENKVYELLSLVNTLSKTEFKFVQIKKERVNTGIWNYEVL